MAYSAGGFARLRAEIPRYTDKKLKSGPDAIFNDATDALRKLAERLFVPLQQLSQEDRIDGMLPEHFRNNPPPEVLAGLNPVALANLPNSRMFAYYEAKAALEAQAPPLISPWDRRRAYKK